MLSKRLCLILEEYFGERAHARRSQAKRIWSGLCNDTYKVILDGATFVLQRLNKAFDRRAVEDARHICTRMEARGWQIPVPLVNRLGDVCSVGGAGRLWRVWRYIPGSAVAPASHCKTSNELGAVLARFHQDLQQITYRPS